MYCLTKNAHPRDQHISLNHETHVYTVNGQQGYTSVSTLVHRFFKGFDPESTARTMVRRSDFRTNQRYSQYWPLITEDFSEELMIRTVCQEWKRQGVNAADLGTKLHKYIEDKYNEIIEGRVGNKVGEDMKTRGPEYDYADQFMEKKHREGFVPFRTEWMLYDERLKISGTIDMIYYHPVTQTYHMVDWKRSKKISKYGYRRYGLGPCSNLQDCNYSHYSLQLNIYKWLLETHYSIQIQSMDIVVLHPSNKTFLEFEIETFAFTRTLLGLPPIDETDAPPRQLYTWI